jgi:LPS-assembly lipoprotein
MSPHAALRAWNSASRAGNIRSLPPKGAHASLGTALQEASMRAAKLSLVLLLIGLLSACGFKLRGSADLPAHQLPFSTIALSLADTSEFYAQLKRGIEASSKGTRVVDSKEAEAVLVVLADSSQKTILSLSSGGKAREYRLIRTFSFKVQAANNSAAPAAQGRYVDAPTAPPNEYVPPNTIVLRRDITYNDDLVLSKESEEGLLWRDIQNDLVQQLLRRLAAARLQTVKVD